METDQLAEIVERALAEDLGSGDVTSEATVGAEALAEARITQKAPGVVFGLDAADDKAPGEVLEDEEDEEVDVRVPATQ